MCNFALVEEMIETIYSPEFNVDYQKKKGEKKYYTLLHACVELVSCGKLSPTLGAHFFSL